MSIPKLVKIISDSKNFESELARANLTPKEEKELIQVCNAIIYKNDLDSLKIFISFMREKEYTLSGISEIYLADSNQWEMLKLLYESKICQNIDLSNLFSSDKIEVLEKMIEYKLVSKFDLEIMILTNANHISYKMYKKFIQMYPDEFTVKKRKELLYYCNWVDSSIEIFKEHVELIDCDRDIADVLFMNFNLERYNILIQKVSREDIIHTLLNPRRRFQFDPDLIAMIDIHDELQQIINNYETRLLIDPTTVDYKPFDYKLLLYSGLDFKKHYLIRCALHLTDSEFEVVMREIPDDYYTDIEKSNIIFIIQTSEYMNKLRFLIKLGWKIYDTPENCNRWVLPKIIYSQFPKY